MPDTPNGKVTLALIGQKLDHQTAAIKELKETIDGMEGCIRSLEIDTGKHEEAIKTIKADVISLEQKSNTWSVLNSIGIAVLTWLGLQK